MALAAALGTLALSGPWLWVLAQQRLAPGPGSGALALVGGGSFNALDPNLLWAGQMRALVALALAAALWGVWRRAWPVADLLGWLVALVVCANPWLALYLLPAAGLALLLWALARRSFGWALLGAALLPANPWLLRLPYLALITNEALVISLFIPLGALIGGAAAALWGQARRPAVRAAGALGLAALALSGAWGMRDVVNPATVLATPADVAAIAWAAEHTPPDARFLINTAPWLGTGRGADGGFWLLPLAGRWTSAPPVLFDYGPPAYVAATRARNRLVMSFQPGQEQQIYELIARERITHIYLGARPGALTLAAFPRSAGFTPVYERDGVTILKVRPSS